MNTSTTVQTPAELQASNPVFPAWMREVCEGATTVRVTRQRTFAGTFVVAVERAS